MREALPFVGVAVLLACRRLRAGWRRHGPRYGCVYAFRALPHTPSGNICSKTSPRFKFGSLKVSLVIL